MRAISTRFHDVICHAAAEGEPTMFLYWGAAALCVALLAYACLGTLDGSLPHSAQNQRQIHVIR